MTLYEGIGVKDQALGDLHAPYFVTCALAGQRVKTVGMVIACRTLHPLLSFLPWSASLRLTRCDFYSIIMCKMICFKQLYTGPAPSIEVNAYLFLHLNRKLD